MQDFEVVELIDFPTKGTTLTPPHEFGEFTFQVIFLPGSIDLMLFRVMLHLRWDTSGTFSTFPSRGTFTQSSTNLWVRSLHTYYKLNLLSCNWKPGSFRVAFLDHTWRRIYHQNCGQQGGRVFDESTARILYECSTKSAYSSSEILW